MNWPKITIYEAPLIPKGRVPFAFVPAKKDKPARNPRQRLEKVLKKHGLLRKP